MHTTLMKVLKWIFAIYIVVFSSIWLSSGFVIKQVSEQPLLEQGFVLNDESSISFNPFVFQLKAENLALAPKHGQYPTLTLDEVDIDLSVWPLFSKTISFDALVLRGLATSISKNSESITVAGKTISTNADQAQETQKPSPLKWQVITPEINIENITLAVDIDGKALNVELKEITLSDLVASESSTNVDVSVLTLINKNELSITSTISKQDEITAIALASTINMEDLSSFSAFAAPYQMSGNLSLELDSEIELNGSKLTVKSDKLTATIKNTEVRDASYLARLISGELSLSNIKIEQTENDLLVSFDSSLGLTEISAQDSISKQTLTSIKSVDIGKVSTEILNQNFNLGWQSLVVGETTLLDTISVEYLPVSSFKQLSISHGELTKTSVILGDISLSGLIGNIVVEQDKRIANVPVFDDQQHEVTEPPTNQEEKLEKDMPTVKLASFTLTDDATIEVTDQSVTPNYKETVTIKNLTLSEVDSLQPDLVSKAKAQVGFDDFSTFDVTIDMTPFAQEPEFDIKAQLKEMSLHKVSPYVQNAMQHSIKSGQLAIDLKTVIKDSKIDGNAAINIAAFELSSANDVEVDTLKDQSAIPLSAALSLLKDSDGNITIDLPISGDINAPSFGLSGFATLLVKKATMMAAKDYLMTTFVPYANVVSIAMAAGEHLLKVRLNDLPYQAKITELSETQLTYATELAKLLKDKDDLKVTICAVGVPEDISMTNGQVIEDAAQLNEIQTLSNLRTKRFKQHLVSLGAPSEKIIPCAAEIDFTKDAKPRLTFST